MTAYEHASHDAATIGVDVANCGIPQGCWQPDLSCKQSMTSSFVSGWQALAVDMVRISDRYAMSTAPDGLLGEGSFSTCRKGVDIVTGRAVAVKVYKACHRNDTQDKFMRQISILQELNQDADLDVPRRHQSLAYIPSMFTKGLRKAGIVTEKPTIPELIAAFQKIDKDGDGQLDREEIKAAMAEMGADDDAVDEMIKAADTDGDGKISKDEFLISMTASAKEEAKEEEDKKEEAKEQP